MPASPVSPAPRVAPPRIIDADVSLNVEHSLSGHPTDVGRAHASAMTRFALDAPTGSHIRVEVPAGSGLNGWAWGNSGKTGVSFAKDGAAWVTTVKEPLRQLSLQSSRHIAWGKPGITVTDTHARVDDMTPRVTVDGVASTDAGRGPTTVFAPAGWQTRSAGGAVDAQRRLAGGGDDTVVSTRPGAAGTVVEATFTGQFDGARTTGVGRAIVESKDRVADAAARTAYIGMALLGLAG